LLSWFPEYWHANNVTCKAKEAFNELDERSLEIGNNIICCGVAEFNGNRKPQLRDVANQLLKHEDRFLRYSSAIYLSFFDNSPNVESILVELRNDRDYDICFPEIPFCHGLVSQYAEATVERLKNN
jgi:hypothetical protein